MDKIKSYLKSIGYIEKTLSFESLGKMIKDYSKYLDSIIETDAEVVEAVFAKIKKELDIDRSLFLLKKPYDKKDEKTTALRALIVFRLAEKTGMDNESISKLIGRSRSIVSFYKLYYQPTNEFYYYKDKLSWH